MGNVLRVAVCSVIVGIGTAAVAALADDDELARAARVEQAKKNLNARMTARYRSGWVPKPKDEQLATLLRASGRKWGRLQERARQRAVYEAAKAEVYHELSRKFRHLAYAYYSYTPVLEYDPYSGELVPTIRRNRYLGDRYALFLSAYYNQKGLRSDSLAAANKYRANTHLQQRVTNARMRMAALKKPVENLAEKFALSK